MSRYADLKTVLADQDAAEPVPGARLRRVQLERMTFQEVHLSAGAEVPSHAHDNEQVTYIISGRLRLTLGDAESGTEDVVLTPGDVLRLPGGLPHGGVAEDDTHAIDVFSPAVEKSGLDG